MVVVLDHSLRWEALGDLYSWRWTGDFLVGCTLGSGVLGFRYVSLVVACRVVVADRARACRMVLDHHVEDSMGPDLARQWDNRAVGLVDEGGHTPADLRQQGDTHIELEVVVCRSEAGAVATWMIRGGLRSLDEL